MSKRLVDQHTFVLWRYEDNSVDIQCQREGDDTFEELAYLEACVLARSLGEELKSSEEVFCLRAYDNGSAATAWRGAEGCMDSWRHFRWYKKITHQATYGSLVSWPEPPRFLLESLWALEYASARVAAWFRCSGAGLKSSPVESDAEEEPCPEQAEGVVIPFPNRKKQ